MKQRVYEVAIEVIRCGTCGAAKCGCVPVAEMLEVTVTGTARYTPGCESHWNEWDGGGPGEPDGYDVELLECYVGDWRCSADELTKDEAEYATECITERADMHRDALADAAAERRAAEADRQHDGMKDRRIDFVDVD